MTPAPRAEGDSYRAVLARAAAGLAQEHHLVLQLRLIEQCKPAVVARMLRVAPEAADQLYTDALRSLRAKLRETRC